MTYDRFDDSQKCPILIYAEVSRTVFGFSVGVYPKEILSVFPSKGVHLSWTLEQNQYSTRGWALGAKSITIHS